VRHATAKNPEQRFASMHAMRTALEAITREYLASVPMETLKIRMLVPRAPSDTGPGFSATMLSPRHMENLTRAVAADAVSAPELVVVQGPGGTFRLTPTPRQEENPAPGTAPAVYRTFPGSERTRPSHGATDDAFAPKPRSSWGKLALVAIPLGAVIGLTLNALTPRGEPAAPAASMAPPPAPEPIPVTPAPPTATAPPPAEPAPPPPPSVEPTPSATPPVVAARPPPKKRTTTAPAPVTTSAPPSPPSTKAESPKTEPAKSDAAKSDVDRMRERARRFEEETRATGKGTTP
jgi:hypothetical protein